MGRRQKKAKGQTPDTQATAKRISWTTLWNSTWLPAALGALLYWAAQPPLSLWPLAWVAPVPWLVLVRRTTLQGKRPYLKIWAVAACLWLAIIHWMRFPHPATSIGWLAGGCYVGLYLPAFIALSRVGVQRLKCPMIVVTPVVWIGLELVRSYMITGFTMGALAHSQIHWPLILQTADLGGRYMVDGLIIAIAAGLASLIPLAANEAKEKPWPWKPAVAALCMLGAAIGYGVHRMSQTPPASAATATIALTQGNIPLSLWPNTDPEDILLQGDSQFRVLTTDIASTEKGLDLIVWPETVWASPLIDVDDGYMAGLTPEQQVELRQFEQEMRDRVALLAKGHNVPFLLGVGCYRLTGDHDLRFNSAVHVGCNGELLGRYDKIHRVPFGEYVPILSRFPDYNFLATVCQEVTPGDAPRAFFVGEISITPNICYESTIPHVIRRQVVALRDQEKEPDALLNISNDGWFLGSNEIDLHFACSVFRAVEMRKPVIVSSNGGYAGHIDANGTILATGPRYEPGYVVARVVADPRDSVYLRYGDVLARACLLICVLLAGVGIRSWRTLRKESRTEG